MCQVVWLILKNGRRVGISIKKHLWTFNSPSASVDTWDLHGIGLLKPALARINRLRFGIGIRAKEVNPIVWAFASFALDTNYTNRVNISTLTTILFT